MGLVSKPIKLDPTSTGGGFSTSVGLSTDHAAGASPGVQATGQFVEVAPTPVFASQTVQEIADAVQGEQEAAVDPGTPFHYECIANLVTVGVLRALEEVHKRGGLAKTMGRIEAERQKAGCKTDLIGERVPWTAKEKADEDDGPSW